MWNLLTGLISKAYLVVFIGVIVTAIAEILRSKSKRKEATYLLVVGILISGIGAVLSMVQSETFERKVQGNITGGDSYCYVETHFDMHFYDFSLIHVGEFPLYDVNVEIHDMSKRSELMKARRIPTKGTFTRDELNELHKHRDLVGESFELLEQDVIFRHNWPSFPPGSITMPILRVKLPIEKQAQQYLVKIYARNGTITQPIRFLKVKGKWEMSTRVQKYDNVKLKFTELRNRLHPDVPLKETYAGE
jgi:amino acid transporter